MREARQGAVGGLSHEWLRCTPGVAVVVGSGSWDGPGGTVGAVVSDQLQDDHGGAVSDVGPLAGMVQERRQTGGAEK
ncbi:hypothetical protein GCM10010424_63700 [Streptomyces lienomycini]